MSTSEYIVLRASSFPAPGATGFVTNLRDVDRAMAVPVQASIKMESLRKRDLVDMRRDPEVQGVAPAMPVRLIEPITSEPADAQENDGTTWGIAATNVDKSPFSGRDITVAILDTGIDADHAAFQGVDLVQKDFTGEGDGDTEGHGTHCAGTVFGRDIDGFRFGVAQGVERALIGKVLGPNGGRTDQILNGILWAVENGAHVISMSLGMDFAGYADSLITQEGYPADLAISLALQGYRDNIRLFDRLAALIRARSEGAFGKPTIVIAAAGNESRRGIRPDYEIIVAPPAAADEILAVGALGQQAETLQVADFANTGPDVSGPGVGILSTWPGGGFRTLSGTSMATPYVAGIAALWAEKLLAETGRLSIGELQAKLIGTASKTMLADGVEAFDVGAGLIQAPLD